MARDIAESSESRKLNGAVGIAGNAASANGEVIGQQTNMLARKLQIAKGYVLLSGTITGEIVSRPEPSEAASRSQSRKDQRIPLISMGTAAEGSQRGGLVQVSYLQLRMGTAVEGSQRGVGWYRWAIYSSVWGRRWKVHREVGWYR